jgi:hypothetical protein
MSAWNNKYGIQSGPLDYDAGFKDSYSLTKKPLEYESELLQAWKPQSAPQVAQAPQAVNAGQKVIESAANAAPFMSTPQGAAVAIGGQALMQYAAQKAADERAKRERDAQIAQEHGGQEQQAFSNLMNVYRGALR